MSTHTAPRRTLTGRDLAMVKVLGAIAYGELKAYEGAVAQAEEVDDEAERQFEPTMTYAADSLVFVA